MNRRLAITILPAVLCSSCRRQSARIPVRLAVSSQVYAALPVAIAESLGYYEEEGLTVHIEDFQGFTKGVQALVGGSVDVTCASFTNVIRLAARGLDVKAFTTVMIGSQLMLVVSPKESKAIRHVRDLRGATVGVDLPGGNGHHVLNYLLVRHGLSPEDVKVIGVGVNATAIAALERNKVTASVIMESQYHALRQKGLDPLVLVDQRNRDEVKRIYGVEGFPGIVLMATGPWLREHPDTARRLARSVVRAAQWMHQQTPSVVLENMPARYRGEQSVALASVTTLLPMFSKTGAMPADGAEAYQRMMAVSDERVRASNLDLSKTYTNEFAMQ